ncbi:Methyltransferase-like protein 21A, partial [Rhizopus stolonifer]
MDSITDQEFCAKLEKHFSLYRINLRSPLASKIAPHHWYRIDLLLVNELGLFRRADIEPDGQVEIACDLYTPSSESITPFKDDADWQLIIRPACVFSEGQLSTHPLPVPGFVGSGKGTFEFCIQPKHDINQDQTYSRFLHIRPKHLVEFPKLGRVDNKSLESILPLVVGPIQIMPQLKPENKTSLPLELWQHQDQSSMVYEGYRVFPTSVDPPVNIAIHEMWDTGIPGKIWDSALVMLDFIKKMLDLHPQYIHQKHTLDLSAGTGLLGLYVASMILSPTKSTLQQGSITITELDEAVDLIDKNVVINQFLDNHKQVKLQTRNLLWGNQEQAKECGKADLIIASDVLYEAQFFHDLVKTFVDLSTQNTRIYIGYKRRGLTEQEEDYFWSLCQEHFDITLLKYEGNDTDDALIDSIIYIKMFYAKGHSFVLSFSKPSNSIPKEEEQEEKNIGIKEHTTSSFVYHHFEGNTDTLVAFILFAFSIAIMVYLYTILLIPTVMTATIAHWENRTIPSTGIQVPVDIGCPLLKPRTTPPQSVHDLRPDDIRIVAGLGDSVMAAFAAKGVQQTFFNIENLYENRGISFAMGGVC